MPPPGQHTSGGGDSKYVSGLLKHINNQNEETVNPFPSDENSIWPAVGNAQVLLDLGCFGPNLLDMGCER